ncbi:hypothetical protein LINPERHAP2_LOCUS13930, partial [Linum perenne]
RLHYYCVVRYYEEVATHARLHHQHIVRYYHLGSKHQKVGSKWKRVWLEQSGGRVCYSGKVVDVAQSFSQLGIHFAGGVDLFLDGFGMFLQGSSHTCSFASSR